MKQLTILVDLDDTLTDLLGPWVEELDSRFNLNVKKEDITSWDIASFFPIPKSEVFRPLQDPDFWEKVKPREDARFYLRKLFDDGHHIYIVTDSYSSSLSSKLYYSLYRHYPYLTWENVIVTGHKQMIHGDVLVDDAPKNFGGDQGIQIMLSAPHNEHFNSDPLNVWRARDWSEVYKLISFFASRR